MARKSSLKTLPPKILAAVVQALEGGSTIDDVVGQLAELGHKRSRSAVGRYAKEYGELAQHQRDVRVMAEAFAGEFGGADNAEGKLMIQMLTSVGVRMIMPIAAQEDPELAAKDFHFLAKSVKELLSSAKLDAERDARIREEVAKEERLKAAEAVERVARSGERGFSRDTVEAIKREILKVG